MGDVPAFDDIGGKFSKITNRARMEWSKGDGDSAYNNRAVLKTRSVISYRLAENGTLIDYQMFPYGPLKKKIWYSLSPYNHEPTIIYQPSFTN